MPISDEHAGTQILLLVRGRSVARDLPLPPAPLLGLAPESVTAESVTAATAARFLPAGATSAATSGASAGPPHQEAAGGGVLNASSSAPLGEAEGALASRRRHYARVQEAEGALASRRRHYARVQEHYFEDPPQVWI